MDILFKTIHGSRLYGLATLDSDWDYYTVVATKPHRRRKKYAKQTIKDGIDSTVIDLSTFRVYCDMGIPQALEALFSPVAEIDMIADFRQNYRVDTAAMMAKYKDTINAFMHKPTYKKQRHALRLALNLTEALETGRFNPRLSREDVIFVDFAADMDNYLEILRKTIP